MFPDQLDLLRIPRARLNGFFVTILLLSSLPPVDPSFQLLSMLPPLDNIALASTLSLHHLRFVASTKGPEFSQAMDWAGPAPAHAWNPEESPLADMLAPAGILAALPGSPAAGSSLHDP